MCDKYFKKVIDRRNYLIYNPKSNMPIIIPKKMSKMFNLLEKPLISKDNRKVIDCDDYQLFAEEVESSGFYENKYDYEEVERIVKNQRKSKKKKFFIHLTDRCNLSCTYCYNVEQRKQFDDMSFSKWKTIIDKISGVLGTALITGGEPFLHPDFNLIVSYLKKEVKNVRIESFTNGNVDFNLIGKAKEVFEILDQVNISCDRITDGYQKRTGFSVEVFKRNIDWVDSNGFKDKVAINSVIGKGDLEFAREVFKYANSKGIRFTYSLQLPSKKSDKKFLPSIRDYKLLVQDKVLSRSTEKIIHDTLNLKCSAAVKTFSIDSHGNCFPCQNFHFQELKMGNLLVDNLDAILSSRVVDKFKSHHILKVEGCKTCNLRFVCGGGCIADTYRLHGSIDKKPDILCSYYKIGAVQRLVDTEFEN